MEGSQVQRAEPRKILDNIHGFMRYDDRVWYFIDTPEFQKLRYVRQVGCLSHVFPGATHTRFQHSLGTGFLAKTFIELLMKNNQSWYKGQDKRSAIYTVTLAGIMHDVGHGPFSHTFDNEVVNTKVLQKDTKVEGKEWSHELGSQIIFRYIVKRKNLIPKIISQSEVQRVVNLIHGKKDGTRDWQFELISNKITGIDVDKLDYFRRDAYYLGAKGININHQLLMNEARILKNQKQYSNGTICYPSKYALEVNDVFFSRYKLYKTYYLNNISKGIQFMVLDVLKFVEPIFQFNKICRQIRQGQAQIQRYLALTDSILERIQHYQERLLQNQDHKYRLKAARKILNDLKQRKIYRFVREVQTSIESSLLVDQQNKKNLQNLQSTFNAQNIIKYIVQKSGVKEEYFRVAVTDVGYGMKKINPLDRVNFFRKQQSAKHILTYDEFNSQTFSILYTKAFAERYAKLFVVDKQNIEQTKKINQAFKDYFDKKKEDFKLVLSHLNFGRTNFYKTEVAGNTQFDFNTIEDTLKDQNVPDC